MKKHFSSLFVFALGVLFSLGLTLANIPGAPSNQAIATPGTDEPPISCLDIAAGNTANWPTSNSWKQSPWDINFVVSSSGSTTITPLSTFVDVNGDGLADYVYVETRFNDSMNRRSCLHLNNGTGWDLVYKCYATKSGSVWTFRGDCANV